MEKNFFFAELLYNRNLKLSRNTHKLHFKINKTSVNKLLF